MESWREVQICEKKEGNTIKFSPLYHKLLNSHNYLKKQNKISKKNEDKDGNKDTDTDNCTDTNQEWTQSP